MVTARSFAARNGYEIDVDREFIALGACNVAASLSQGFAVTWPESIIQTHIVNTRWFNNVLPTLLVMLLALPSPGAAPSASSSTRSGR